MIVPAPRPIGIPRGWEELDGSPTEHRGLMGASAIMRIKGPWSQRYQVIDFYVDNWLPYPHQVQEFGVLGMEALRAISGSARPFGTITDKIDAPVGTIALYDQALVEIRFGIPEIGVPVLTDVRNMRGRGDVISETFESNSEFLSLDPDLFRWSSGEGPQRNLTEQEAPGKSTTGLDYLFTRHGVDSIPLAAWHIVDCVNDSTLYPLSRPLMHLRFREETLLYRGYRAHRTADRNMRTIKMSMTYRFSWRREGWNRFYRGDTGTWDEIVCKKSGAVHKNFKPENFLVF